MTDALAMASFVLVMGMGLAAATVLTIKGHWGIALMILLIVGSVHIKTDTSSAKPIPSDSPRDAK